MKIDLGPIKLVIKAYLPEKNCCRMDLSFWKFLYNAWNYSIYKLGSQICEFSKTNVKKNKAYSIENCCLYSKDRTPFPGIAHIIFCISTLFAMW